MYLNIKNKSMNNQIMGMDKEQYNQKGNNQRKRRNIKQDNQ